ncbi:MAG: C45 family peptidase [Planctomycetota bacterium]
MKTNRSFVQIFVAATLIAQPCLAKQFKYPTQKVGGGELRYIENIPVATLSGTPEQIGLQYAKLVGKPGEPLLKYTRTMLTRAGLQDAWPMVANVSKQLMSRAPLRYQSEIKTVIETAVVDPDEMFVANSLLELRRLGCSTLIVEAERSATGSPIFGRNFDFPTLGILHRYSVLTIVRPQGTHAFASVGFPGLMGVISGMNDAGLAIATLDVEATSNGSPQFDPSGPPMMLVFRQILENCETVAEAEALLENTKATTWANLAVADTKTSAVFEITPTEVGRRDAVSGILPCTNHFRCEGLAANTTCSRFESLLTATSTDTLSIGDVHQHLDEVNQDQLTLQTMIFEPRELMLHLAIGKLPSSKSPLVRINLSELFTTE